MLKTPPVLTFDKLLSRFPANARAQAELAMTLGQSVEVVRLTRVSGTTLYTLVIDGSEVTRVAAR